VIDRYIDLERWPTSSCSEPLSSWLSAMLQLSVALYAIMNWFIPFSSFVQLLYHFTVLLFIVLFIAACNSSLSSCHLTCSYRYLFNVYTLFTNFTYSLLLAYLSYSQFFSLLREVDCLCWLYNNHDRRIRHLVYCTFLRPRQAGTT